MFCNCKKIEEIDMLNWNMSNIKKLLDMNHLFYGCSNIKIIKMSTNFNFNTNINYMIENVKDINKNTITEEQKRELGGILLGSLEECLTQCNCHIFSCLPEKGHFFWKIGYECKQLIQYLPKTWEKREEKELYLCKQHGCLII